MTIEQLINKKAQEKIEEAKFYIKEGWSREEALRETKETSTLGKKTWEKIEAAV